MLVILSSAFIGRLPLRFTPILLASARTHPTYPFLTLLSVPSGEPLTSNSPSHANRSKVPVIGILGGIGSGKSSVVRHVDGLKLHIVDADKIGHKLLSDSEIQIRIRQAFGEQVFADPTTIDRSQLAARVFGESADRQAARSALNDIMHPAIRLQIHSEIDSVPMDVDAVILDAALLLEGGWEATCDWLIFVDTPKVIRLQRVQDNRGWSADELNRREASQISVEAKRQRADFEVDNSGSIENAAQQMKQTIESILPPR